MTKIIWNDASPKSFQTVNGSTQLHIISYAGSRFRSFYLDMDLPEAMSRFEKMMTERNIFEIEDEGWNASVETITFSENGEAWVGAVGDQLKAMFRRAFGTLT